MLVTGTIPAAQMQMLSTFSQAELALYFRFSWVSLSEGDTAYTFEQSGYEKCERSRVRRPDVAAVELDGQTVMLSERDRRAIGV